MHFSAPQHKLVMSLDIKEESHLNVPHYHYNREPKPRKFVLPSIPQPSLAEEKRKKKPALELLQFKEIYIM